MFNVNQDYQKIKEDRSVLLDHMDLQIIKIDRLDKIVRRKARLVVLLEIGDRGIKPDRFAEIKLVTDSLKRVKHFVRARFRAVVADDGIPEHMVVLESSCPQSKHCNLSLLNHAQMDHSHSNMKA